MAEDVDFSTEDPVRICRTCLQISDDNWPIYSKCLCLDEEQCLGEILTLLTLVKVGF